MTETAETIISDALVELGCYAPQTNITQVQASKGIFYLNAMMLDFDACGINLGYTLVSSLGDEITVNDSAIEPIVMNLAIMISPLFNENATSTSLFQNARDGYRVLKAISLDSAPNTPYHENTPRGSGNYSDRGRLFYTEPTPAILTERGGKIANES